LIGGNRCTEVPLDSGIFVQPTIAIPKSVDPTDLIWKTEAFAPILNVAAFDSLEQAIEWNNAVPQVIFSP
jgi:aldehyde dehydrogenase family 7 member A1